MRLREGKEYRKLEECNSIFVTMNKDIRNETNKLLNVDSLQIGPVFSDLDITAIIWLKSLINNTNLPEMKLTENAMAAIKPTTAIRKKINQSVDKLKNVKYNVTPESLCNLLCSNYFVENLMNNVNGDTKKINPNVLLNTYEETLKQNNILDEKDKELNIANEELTRKLLQKEEDDKRYRNNIYIKYNKKENIVNRIIIILENFFKLFICIALAYVSYKYSTKTSKSIVINIMIILVTIYCVLSNFIPINIFQFFNKLLTKINNVIFIKINKYYTKKADKEIEYIFKK